MKVTRAALAKWVLGTEPERWPTTDEWPEASTDDLVRAYQQSTIDSESDQE